MVKDKSRNQSRFDVILGSPQVTYESGGVHMEVEAAEELLAEFRQKAGLLQYQILDVHPAVVCKSHYCLWFEMGGMTFIGIRRVKYHPWTGWWSAFLVNPSGRGLARPCYWLSEILGRS